MNILLDLPLVAIAADAGQVLGALYRAVNEVLDGRVAGYVGDSPPLADLVDACLHTEYAIDIVRGRLQRCPIVIVALDDFSTGLLQRLCHWLVGVAGECTNAPAVAQQMTGGCAALP